MGNLPIVQEHEEDQLTGYCINMICNGNYEAKQQKHPFGEDGHATTSRSVSSRVTDSHSPRIIRDTRTNARIILKNYGKLFENSLTAAQIWNMTKLDLSFQI